jgi:hypothetical protein
MPMPYSMEVGPYLSLFESYFNDDPKRAVDALNSLRTQSNNIASHQVAAAEGQAGQAQTDRTALEADNRFTDIFLKVPFTELEGGPSNRRTTEGLVDYMDQSWFGLPARNGATSTAGAQVPVGVWEGWEGQAQAIVRETIIRALEVSLGLDHSYEPIDGAVGQHWPLGLRAVCGLRWWEGWIRWLRWETSGYVDVIFLTPPNSIGDAVEPVLLRPIGTRRKPPAGDNYEVQPIRADGKQGLWVVGALLEEKEDPSWVTSSWVTANDLGLPPVAPKYRASDELVTVSPPESQGGVQKNGRPWR